MDLHEEVDYSAAAEDAAPAALPYDAEVPYEAQVAPAPAGALADRIGRNKLYLLSDSAVARAGKRKRGTTDDDDDTMDADDAALDGGAASAADADGDRRANALLLTGPPVAHLSTDKLFAYSAHYAAAPLGLEWVDDATAVLVFASAAGAADALRALTRDPAQRAHADGAVTAKSVPTALWPPEARIAQGLGKGAGLRGALLVRWARAGDVKKRGARKESEFYRKHGEPDGARAREREGSGEPAKRRRQNTTREDLDAELDAFLQGGDEDAPAPGDAAADEPASKMYADNMDEERPPIERGVARSRNGSGRDRASREDGRRGSRGGQRHRKKNGNGEKSAEPRKAEPRRRGERPVKSQQELDDELDAFINAKD